MNTNRIGRDQKNSSVFAVAAEALRTAKAEHNRVSLCIDTENMSEPMKNSVKCIFAIAYDNALRMMGVESREFKPRQKIFGDEGQCQKEALFGENYSFDFTTDPIKKQIAITLSSAQKNPRATLEKMREMVNALHDASIGYLQTAIDKEDGYCVISYPKEFQFLFPTLFDVLSEAQNFRDAVSEMADPDPERSGLRIEKRARDTILRVEKTLDLPSL